MSLLCFVFFFFNDTATTEIYTLSLHDALPISPSRTSTATRASSGTAATRSSSSPRTRASSRSRGCCGTASCRPSRSEEHTSELQSRQYLVCRLLLEKKKHPQKIQHL